MAGPKVFEELAGEIFQVIKNKQKNWEAERSASLFIIQAKRRDALCRHLSVFVYSVFVKGQDQNQSP